MNMNTIKHSICLLTLSCTLSNASEQSDKCERLYIDAYDIYYDDDVRIKIDDELVLVKQVWQDEQGFFVLESDIPSLRKSPDEYHCQECDAVRYTEGGMDLHVEREHSR